MNEVSLPAEPLVVIQPSKRWSILSFKDIWAFRELLFFLTWRDVKVRYKQTALGAAWAILQPLFMMIIFTIFFGRLAGVASSGIPYPLFALAGLVPWTFFANAITASGDASRMARRADAVLASASMATTRSRSARRRAVTSVKVTRNSSSGMAWIATA